MLGCLILNHAKTVKRIWIKFDALTVYVLELRIRVLFPVNWYSWTNKNGNLNVTDNITGATNKCIVKITGKLGKQFADSLTAVVGGSIRSVLDGSCIGTQVIDRKRWNLMRGAKGLRENYSEMTLNVYKYVGSYLYFLIITEIFSSFYYEGKSFIINHIMSSTEVYLYKICASKKQYKFLLFYRIKYLIS